MEEPAAAEEWQGATQKRKAWAKSRDSWQASEAEDLSAAATQLARGEEEEEDDEEEEEEEEEDRERDHLAGGKLPLAAESGHSVPNEKIAIWLKDCRTPLGASLDEQSNPLLKGMLVRNGGSFEDDLSLGAEANHLRSDTHMETCNGMLAKEKRLQFHQKGRSMNSTGSGKSSATVSSVSELLELYEEDPEEVLYNLGFGRDEPDIASKIPARFFNSSSFARGIDIKVFLNAQMQRMEVENPNFALTSRFRQIEVLTTVANAFSSLYSQVSGTPLQKIGSMNSVSSSKEASSPPPLNRSNTASRLMKTLSKLNLCGAQQADSSGCSTPSPVEKGKGPAETESEENDAKNDSKLPKFSKKKDSPSFLATVKEEIASSQSNATDTHRLEIVPAGTDDKHENTVSAADVQNSRLVSPQDRQCGESGLLDPSSLSSSPSAPNTTTCESGAPAQRPPVASVGREPCMPLANPSVMNLMLQQKDSFEMEEIQSTEGDLPHVPASHQLAVTKSRKDQLLRTASQHSDSSGFAEDSSTDCSPFNQLQVQESLQGMGSSADSCDSETTVTSHSEEQKTPIAKERPCFNKFEEEEEEEEDDDEEDDISQVEKGKVEAYSENLRKDGKRNCDYEAEQNNGGESKSSHVSKIVGGEDSSKDEGIFSEQKELELLEEGSDESDVDNDTTFEFPQYQTHHILKSLESLEGDSSSPSSLDRVHVALQRARMRVIGTSDSRAGRSFFKSKDLLRKQRQWLAESGYPLRRSQSLPTALLNPVKVVSSVNVQLTPGKETLCGPPSFTYKYTHMEEDEKLTSEDDKQEDQAATSQPVCKSTLFIATSSSKREVPQAGLRRLSEAPSPTRGQSCPLQTPAHMSQSTCSLHSLPAEWLDRPLCEHMRTLSTHSVPSISGSSLSALLSPFSCPFSPRHSGYSHRPHAINPPSTVEMQLRRVLHDIRNSLQNLSQYPVMRGQDLSAATGYTTQRSSILPLYENTFQELQVVRRNLNLFRTQMMDLELAMLRQQTTVYQHMTEEERYEADQLQSLRKSVRMELQELEMQLEERLLALEDQLRSLHMSSPYRPQTHLGMYGSRSADNLSCPSPLNVIEPVSELMREQSFLKSELGLGLGDLGLENLPAEGTESVFSHGNSDSSSVCSTASRKAGVGSSELTGKSKSQSKKLYRASVALTPTPPVRTGTGQQVESSEEFADSKPEMEHKLERVPLVPSFDEIHRSVEQEELQQVIREIKESIVGEIRREIVSGLLAAVSPQSRSTTAKQDAQL
ncbi:protein ITPRID2 [Phasianus colchicus]|uniref:protein ITPRID2 n=1 Tax=Phasianus colchicus TaxID=9054 RepID=UPI00129EC02C|nr:protein ITPRID2 [Phasianus colchicus]